MNKIEIIGRLTATPELKTTASGKSVTEFTIAVDRFADGEKQADFIRCTAWNKQADIICRYKQQGDLMAVCGSLRVEKYKDRNGNDKYKTYVLVSEVEFFGSRQTVPADAAAPVRDQTNGQIPDAADDDFPF